MTSGTIIPRAEYAHHLLATGLELPNIRFSFGTYYLPPPIWPPEFGRLIADRRVQYTTGVYECFQFARYAAAMADLEALKAGITTRHSLGEVHGILTVNGTPTSHEANLVLCSDLVLYFFDPQNCEDPANILPWNHPSVRFQPTGFRV